MQDTQTIEKIIDFLRYWNCSTLIAIELSGRIITKSFSCKQDIITFLETHLNKSNLYFQVNPPKFKVNKKTSKEDIKEVRWLYVDIDPKKENDIIAERLFIRDLLTNKLPAGVNRPTAVIDSGGGYQAYWKLKNPYTITDQKSIDEIERYLSYLIEVFGADPAAKNIDRILRLPYTLNIPSEKKKKFGRKAALSEVIYIDNELEYNLSDFKQADIKSVNISEDKTTVESIDELDNWDVPDTIKAMIVTGEHPIEAMKYDTRSEALMAVCCNLVHHKVPSNIIKGIILDPNYKISDSVLEKHDSLKYANRQVKRATEKVGAEQEENPLLKELNERHACITNMGGKFKILEKIEDPTFPGRTKLSLQSKQSFIDTYMNQFVVIGKTAQGLPKKITAGDWWLSHPYRRTYKSIIFLPSNECPDEMYNRWNGFSFKFIEGDKHRTYLNHIFKVICNNNQSHYDYLINWMAYAIQHPDEPGYVAIVLRGKEGTGKGSFAKTFARLFGRHAMQINSAKHLTGNFNYHLQETIFLFADEAFSSHDKAHEATLKRIITEETLSIEGKGDNLDEARNFLHIVLSSNSNWVVPAGSDSRRFFVLDVSEAHKEDTAYFKQITDDMESGGFDNLLYYLKNKDISNFEVRIAPKTQALNEQKLYSLPFIAHWWYGKLKVGRLLPTDNRWRTSIALQDFYLNYLEESRQTEMKSLSKIQFVLELSKFLPEGYPEYNNLEIISTDAKTKEQITTNPELLQFPILSVCQDLWQNTFQTNKEWKEVAS